MNEIKHIGIVTNITEENVFVAVNDISSCQGCQLQNSCGTGHSGPKEFIIPIVDFYFQIGEEVALFIKPNLGLKAVFLAFIIPFLILLIVLISTLNYLPEWLSGIFVVGFIALYFIVLKWVNPFIKKHFQIEIKKFN
jgi:sigma-E factor negative regulatory protein RseC